MAGFLLDSQSVGNPPFPMGNADLAYREKQNRAGEYFADFGRNRRALANYTGNSTYRHNFDAVSKFSRITEKYAIVRGILFPYDGLGWPF